ncbi:NAD(P)/FAD-dependent oxidoreductase [Jonesia quinghaiensis]|uniref:NAD(P)/FAD-dependent oxidoreductase n=1 Tax=Jonesia quinghaiensis TaxID=262806 RepID=UPI000415D094|nr:NAD(P)/FAD-dependent oxidoreductase [Jonesia quinghaiensis]
MSQTTELTDKAADSEAAATPRPRKVPRIVVLGGGSVGLYSAKRLRQRLGRREAAIVVIDPRPYMTYAPFLPEVAAGSISDRDVVAPHNRALKNIDTLMGKVTEIRHGDKTVVVTPEIGDSYEITYDHLIVGLGSVSRVLPIPGLAENAIGFKNVEEAVAVRNHVLDRIIVAASTWDKSLRERLLTFTFVGGGFAGCEAIAEIEDMAKSAVKQYPTIEPKDLRFVMIEGSNRILPELTEEMAQYALEEMQNRGIEFHLSAFLSSCEDGHVVTSTGVEFDTDTIVWTAGVKANPVIGESDLPSDKMGRVTTNTKLQVIDADGNVVPDAYAAGDCAAVPDVHGGINGFCVPNAQHAVRQAKLLGDNLAAVLRSGELKEYSHKNLGTVASLGLHKGVAILFGRIKLRGFFAWCAHRGYHLYAMPTISRRLRITTGWLSVYLMRRELVPLGPLHDPRAEFRNAAIPPKPKAEQAKSLPDEAKAS